MYNTIAIFTLSVSYAVSICFSLTLSLPPSLSSSLPSSFSSSLPSTLPPSLLTPQNQMCQVCPPKMSWLPTTSSTLEWTSLNGN